MKVFETVSQENTDPTLKISLGKAMDLSTDVVLSTTTGSSAFKALEVAREIGYTGRIIVISHAWGSKMPGENLLLDDDRKQLEKEGICIITAGHALSGCERGISSKFTGVYPVEIIAHTLRMLSQGVKVCVEIGAMAMDAGKIPYQRPVLAIGGSNRGLDTACVLTPSYSAKIFETRIHEILCKPY